MADDSFSIEAALRDAVSGPARRISDSLENVADESGAVASAAQVAQNRIDELGDESVEATAEVSGLSSALLAGSGAAETFERSLSDIDLDNELVQLRRAKDRVDDVIGAFKRMEGVDDLDSLDRLFDEDGKLVTDPKRAGAEAFDLDDAIRPAVERTLERGGPLTTERVRRSLGELHEEGDINADTFRRNAEALDEFGEAILGSERNVDVFDQTIENLRESVDASESELRAFEGSVRGLRGRLSQTDDGLREAGESIERFGHRLESGEEAVDAFGKAILQSREGLEGEFDLGGIFADDALLKPRLDFLQEATENVELTDTQLRALQETLFRLRKEGIPATAETMRGELAGMAEVADSAEMRGAIDDLGRELEQGMDAEVESIVHRGRFGTLLQDRLDVDDDVAEHVIGDLRKGFREHDELIRVGDLFADEGPDISDIIDVEALDISFEDLDQTLEEVEEELDNVMRNLLAQTGANTQLIASNKLLEESFDDVSDEIDEIGDESVESAIKAQMLGLALKHGPGGAETFKRLERAKEMIRDLLPENPITTLNLGPVNIALTRMFQTVTLLVGLIGPFIALIGALATAFITAAGAVGSFLAVGLFGFLEQVEQRFAGVTSKAEALEKLMKALKRLVLDALQPLFQAELGDTGMGAVEFFVMAVQDAIRLLRSFARAMSEILEMEEVEQFVMRIREALFTGDEGPTMMQALKAVIRDVLPLVTDMIVFVINNMPEFLMFLAKISRILGDDVGKTVIQTIDLFAKMITIGAMALDMLLDFAQGLIWVWRNTMGVILLVVDALNRIPIIPDILFGEGGSDGLVSKILFVTGALWALVKVLNVIKTTTKIFMGLGLRGLLVRIGSALAGVSASTAALAAIVVAVAAAFAWMALNMKKTVRIIRDIEGAFQGFFEWLGASREEADRLAAVLMAGIFPALITIKELFKFILDLDDKNPFMDLLGRIWDAMKGIADQVERVISLWSKLNRIASSATPPDSSGGPPTDSPPSDPGERFDLGNWLPEGDRKGGDIININVQGNSGDMTSLRFWQRIFDGVDRKRRRDRFRQSGS